MQTNIVNIDLGDRGYDISIGYGLLNSIDQYVPNGVKGLKAFIVTDDNVQPYAQKVADSLRVNGASFCDVLVIPHGEGTKSYSSLQKLHEWMLENNIHRNSIVFAVGGGVVGDLSGFAASTVLRGVPYIQVPTTILAQVDSSVGGKTGINTKYGKNLAGAFYQPKAVITDISTLKTLPKRELLAGYAEVVKYGLIDNIEFFEWLEINAQKVLSLDDDAISHAIKVSCRAKAAIVEADEMEGGKRALLNLGHTFGHALEAAAGYDGTLLHGEGVSIGTVMAFDLSVRMGLCPKDDLLRVVKHFTDVGLPIYPNNINASPEDIISTMRRDKKAISDRMTFILSRGIGQSFITQDAPEGLVNDVLRDSFCNKGYI